MHTRRDAHGLPWRIPFLLTLSVLACQPADRDASPRPEAGPLTQEVQDAVVALGSEAAGELAGTLVSHLQGAIADEGPAGAIGFCSTEGLPLAAEVSRETGFEIKRTSSRVRNPANAPDSLERVALDHFEARVATRDSLPMTLVQETHEGAYRYYQPLRIQPFCVQCHGVAAELGEGVADALHGQYPEDRATGYSVGDFRGLIRVTVPSSAVESRLEPPNPERDP